MGIAEGKGFFGGLEGFVKKDSSILLVKGEKSSKNRGDNLR